MPRSCEPLLTEQQVDELKKFLGESPYNTFQNFCYGDYVFADSLEKKYGRKMDDMIRQYKREGR